MSHKTSRRPPSDGSASELATAIEEPRSYHPAAVASAVSVIRQAVCEDSAQLVAALLALRPPGGPRTIDLAAIGDAAGFETDLEAICDRLDTVDRAFRQTLGVNLMKVRNDDDDHRRRTVRRKGFEVDSRQFDSPDRPDAVVLSDELCELLDEPHPAPASTNLPVPDAVIASWIATLQAASASEHTRTSIDEACKLVARSFGARRGGLTPAQAPPPAFDPRLLVCDHDVSVFFDRAEALARNGGRLLFWGPPGGGKSSLAQALARRMVGFPTIMVAPADILAYRWGAMERRLATLWSRAATEGAVLVVDELDSLCAARDTGGSSNNNYLIRCLTDEMLRHLDAHPSVPILATVNDPAAIDDAIRRRFAFVVEVRDELTPDRERLAWPSILGLQPPVGWRPCGASVADVALAKVRCRMLGLTEPASLADAIVRARNARLGSTAKRRTRTASSLH